MKATIEIPDGHTLVKVSDTEYKVVKEEKKLPDTWEEFCKMNPINETEYYIEGEGVVYRCTTKIPRNPMYDRNWLPSKEKAEAILALCQLIQLRDCYNDGWVPDWSTNFKDKFCIRYLLGNWETVVSGGSAEIFSFKTVKLRDKFHKNFINLLDKIKPMYQ